MFKHYQDLTDVVSLLVYCPSEHSYLLSKESSGEYWIPSAKADKNCWKMTAHKLNFELFGVDASQCHPFRVYKIWIPENKVPCVYHAVYKSSIKSDVKKKTKTKVSVRMRLQWFSAIELERQRAHSNLRSPEVAIFAQMAIGDIPKDSECMDNNFEFLVEISEDNMIISCDTGGGAVGLTSPNIQLIQAANYSRTDQIRLYKEFLVLVFPALYMSANIFTQFMLDVGWQRSQCASLFRAADVTSRGGLSFSELLIWNAALEPSTPHNGIPAEIRCRYIFRYFDTNRDLKLEYTEIKELVAAARAARQLPVDALSVSREADVCLRQLGLEPNSQLLLQEFLRCVKELLLRGTSSLLRSPRSPAEYLIDLQSRQKEKSSVTAPTPKPILPSGSMESDSQIAEKFTPAGSGLVVRKSGAGQIAENSNRRICVSFPDYSIASYTVRFRERAPAELIELAAFEEEAMSSSTTRLLAGHSTSIDLLGPSSTPTEAMAAIHYFASVIKLEGRKLTKQHEEHISNSDFASQENNKPAWTWADPKEEASLGEMLLKLAGSVRSICANEPRLIRVSSPAYIIGDLHGNLSALLSIEYALWPLGTALTPTRLVFLGDFVDRGPHGTELMAYLFAAKVQRPRSVVLVRGNHETREIQKMFTFHQECINKYGEAEGSRIWSAINEVFDVLPLAVIVDEKVFCCHGGIPPPWVCPLITAIDKVPSPLPRPAEQSSIAWELLWNDPVKSNKITTSLSLELEANEGFAANTKRGTGHVFDQIALERFLAANQLSHVIRAHEVQQNGFMCRMKGRLISVFSSSHYCGATNDCGVVQLDCGKLRLLRISDDC